MSYGIMVVPTSQIPPPKHQFIRVGQRQKSFGEGGEGEGAHAEVSVDVLLARVDYVLWREG